MWAVNTRKQTIQCAYEPSDTPTHISFSMSLIHSSWHDIFCHSHLTHIKWSIDFVQLTKFEYWQVPQFVHWGVITPLQIKYYVPIHMPTALPNNMCLGYLSIKHVTIRNLHVLITMDEHVISWCRSVKWCKNFTRGLRYWALCRICECVQTSLSLFLCCQHSCQTTPRPSIFS